MKQTNQKSNQLAALWLAATENQRWEDFDAFACILYRECCRQVPSGVCNGYMVGAENEIRQEACLILLRACLKTRFVWSERR